MRDLRSSFLLLLLVGLNLQAQTLTQTIRGTVIDKDGKFGLPGATIKILADSFLVRGTSSDLKGSFRIDQTPVGKYKVEISFVGYKTINLNNIFVTSAKEVILDVELEESAFALMEIVVKSVGDLEPQNEMAVVSARSFTVEETNRYAGSRGDPARMVSNYAGVQGADDSRNDIVIRGNSPQSVLWRMEGINIPNPNHFAVPGTGGGPVSMINNKVLANSDFFSGAFPAEFGNSIAGAFDLRMRNGNNEKHELSAQVGFLGAELFAEGPLPAKNGASYLFNYRYSTLSIFNTLGIDIGTSAIPHYQDLSFRVHLPTKGGGSISIFGVGGNSEVDIKISDQKHPEENLYGENDRDQYFTTMAGFTGISFVKPLGKQTYLKAVVAASHEAQVASNDYVYRKLVNGEFEVDSLRRMLDYDFRQTKYSGIVTLSHKINGRNSLLAGINFDLYHYNFSDSILNLQPESEDYYTWRTRWLSKENAFLIQPYVQWKHKFSESTSITAGLHSQYFSLSSSLAVEPRLGLTTSFGNSNKVSLGAGMHSQHQASYLYFYSLDKNNPAILHNADMGFTRSVHTVGGYEKTIAEGFRIKSEIYYQYLYQVPVEQQRSSLSLVNTGANFSRYFPDTLKNSGTGHNYGVEITAERFFSANFFMLFTGSLFESKYRGSDDILRDTDFNGNYAFNALFTREFGFRKGNNTFSVGSKITYVGGRRYGPVDEVQSDLEKEVIYVDETRNSLQFRPYFRLDFRLNYKVNRPRFTHEIAIDLINILNTKNILKLTYAPVPGSNLSPIREEYQLGFLPLFYYKVDFRTSARK